MRLPLLLLVGCAVPVAPAAQLYQPDTTSPTSECPEDTVAEKQRRVPT
jgi:hypothetical protein